MSTTQPMGIQPLDPVVAAWLESGPTTLPDVTREAIVAAVGSMGQRRSLRFWRVGRGLPAGSPMTSEGGKNGVARGRQSTVLRTVATLAVIGALVGLLLAISVGIGSRPADPARVDPTPVPSVASPAPSLPADAGTFVSTTSLGTIEWTRVENERRIYPSTELDGAILGRDYEDQTWWSSHDGVTWDPWDAPLWADGATFVTAEGATLATVSPDGYGVMMGPVSARQVLRRMWYEGPEDAAVYQRVGPDWVALNIPATMPPAVVGLEMTGRRFEGAAAKNASDWIAPAVHYVRVPWGDVYGKTPSTDVDGNPIEDDPWPIWDEDSGLLELHAPAAIGTIVARLEVAIVDGDPPVIEFRDSETGELMHTVQATLAGWTPEALLTWIRGWGLDDVSFVVGRGDEVTVVRPPWPMEEEWSDAIVTTGDRYYTMSYVLGGNYSATAIHLWESVDGIVWSAVDLPPQVTSPFDWAELAAAPSGLYLTIHGEVEQLWSSTDGRSWSQPDVAPGFTGSPTRTEFGWFMQPTYTTAMVSSDGSTWEAVTLPSLPGEPSLTYLGGRFVFGPEQVGDGYRSWIGTLVP